MDFKRIYESTTISFEDEFKNLIEKINDKSLIDRFEMLVSLKEKYKVKTYMFDYEPTEQGMVEAKQKLINMENSAEYSVVGVKFQLKLKPIEFF